MCKASTARNDRDKLVNFCFAKRSLKDCLIANTQSKSVPALHTAVPSLPHTCFFCQHTPVIDDNSVNWGF